MESQQNMVDKPIPIGINLYPQSVYYIIFGLGQHDSWDFPGKIDEQCAN